MSILLHLKKFDWILLGSVFFLLGLGLISLFSSSIGRDDFSIFSKQLIFVAIGLFLMLFFSLLDYRWLKNNPYLILLLYLIGLVSLIGLLFPFAPVIRGVKGWYKIGEISIDPIEYVKMVLIILMAKYFSLRHIEMYRIKHIILSGIYFGIPIALIFLQPDLGSAMLLAILWVVTLFVSGIKIKHLLALMGMGILIFSAGWVFLLHDYQKERVMSFIEPELDPLGIGWSQLQSKIAIGNGKILGQGLGNGSQTQQGFLSEPQTDFIFAAIAEEMGLWGVILLFSVYGLLLWRVLKIGLNAQSNFPRLFAAGFLTLLIVQFFVNVGMNVGLLPIVGLSLPFMSYGGSSLLAFFSGLGILMSIKIRS